MTSHVELSGENPLAPFLTDQRCVILDGGLATLLEAYGFELDDSLWSAKVVLKDADAIRRAHLEFLASGADCIATATYQATFEGFRARGMTLEQAAERMLTCVRLALEARESFWSNTANRAGRIRPLVAASIGPYGAYLADGSEYTGAYDRSEEQLLAFHQRRWHLLASSGADLLACETIPSLHEARALLRLLSGSDAWAWLSFSCKDTVHLADGNALRDAVKLCDATTRVCAVGVNCTTPERIGPLIDEIRRNTRKPIIVYPNSGETYDASMKTWSGVNAVTEWNNATRDWARRGASIIGGCCRVGPACIASIRRSLLGHTAQDQQVPMHSGSTD